MSLEALEAQGKAKTELWEKQLDELHLGLMNMMRQTYQEEQALVG